MRFGIDCCRPLLTEMATRTGPWSHASRRERADWSRRGGTFRLPFKEAARRCTFSCPEGGSDVKETWGDRPAVKEAAERATEKLRAVARTLGARQRKQEPSPWAT